MTLSEINEHLKSQLEQAADRIGTIAEEHASALKTKDKEISIKNNEIADLQTKVKALEDYKAAMEQQVGAVLASGDPKQYEALAKDFLTPAEEKARLEKQAAIDKLKAQLAAMESELNPKV